MARIVIALMAMVLASCGGPLASGQPGTTDSASPPASGTGAEAEATVTAEPWVDPAADLALVRFSNPDSPMSHVFVVDAGGSLRQVTGISRASAGTSDPTWSPDRTLIAFGPPKTGSGMTFEIGVVDADGTDERALGLGQRPQWSPDGTRILFSEVDDVTSEPLSMYVVDVASAEVTELGQGFSARWLPDGRIGFSRMVDGVSVVYIMPLGGGEAEEFAQDAEARWSPDGSSVLLVREGVIWLAAADGSSARELVDGYDPVWSPDSGLIAFAYDVDQDGVPVLAVTDLEGNEVWSGVSGTSPAWSPDGTRLAVEVGVPEPVVRVLDARSGAVIWEATGVDPAW